MGLETHYSVIFGRLTNLMQAGTPMRTTRLFPGPELCGLPAVPRLRACPATLLLPWAACAPGSCAAK